MSTERNTIVQRMSTNTSTNTPPPTATTSSPFRRTTLLSLPLESIRCIADLLSIEKVPECLFEKDQVFNTATIYPGKRQSLNFLGNRQPPIDHQQGQSQQQLTNRERLAVEIDRPGLPLATRSNPESRASAIPGSSKDRINEDEDQGDGSTYWLDGYNEEGYTRDGFTRDGFTRDGYARDGYARDGYARDGYARDGFTRDIYTRDGYTRDGYPTDGLNVDRAESRSVPILSGSPQIPRVNARPIKDNDLIMRGVRDLSAVCRDLRAKLRPVLLARIRIVSQQMMDWTLSAGKEDVPFFRDLRLVPTTHILSNASQLALLQHMVPGQLRSLSISLQPYLLADNVVFGYHPAQDPMGEIVGRVAQMDISGLHLRTNMLGLSSTLSSIRDLTELSIEDVGVWDGGDSSTYQHLISPQHRILSELLRNSATTLQRITFRRKMNNRARDYGHINFDAVLFQEGLEFPCLRELQLRRCTISVLSLKAFLDNHASVETLRFYPETSVQLPALPNTIRQLFTNSHLPAIPAAVSKDMQALCVTANGPLLPAPEQDFVPPLPRTLSTLHARLLPGVSAHQIRRLLENMKKLADIELVVNSSASPSSTLYTPHNLITKLGPVSCFASHLKLVSFR